MCGNYLYGTYPGNKQKALFFDLRKYLPEPVKAIEISQPHDTISVSATGKRPSPSPSQENKQLSTLNQTVRSNDTSENNVQTVGTAVFSTSSSGLTFSSLSQNPFDSNSVILQSVGPGGVVTTSDLMRLPKSSTLEKSYSTLVNTGDDEKLRLVLNMAAQETYIVDEEKDFSLPAVFDRNFASIESLVEEEKVNSNELNEFEYVEAEGNVIGVSDLAKQIMPNSSTREPDSTSEEDKRNHSRRKSITQERASVTFAPLDKMIDGNFLRKLAIRPLEDTESNHDEEVVDPETEKKAKSASDFIHNTKRPGSPLIMERANKRIQS